MPTLSFNISKADIERLSYERYAYPHPMIQKRLFCVYLKAVSRYSNQAIGLIAGLHPNSVSHWLKVYQMQGYQGLLVNKYGTNKSDLHEHSHSILDSFSRKPPHSAAEASQRIGGNDRYCT